ncbi:hypothetical protein FNV43_RR17269 [Rhamnella rubrinervis]|uniref:Glycosyltransferase n=1 Tax=Rhamnella rubrinervis TaxID=2594499 RepID=A0A8K0E3T6_9ROSA|nr:hypothetical protein FNV43_RR17269 [Rhamnella rubrinervis]
MSSETDQLRIFFLPLPTPGHMIPMVEEARVFAKHGVDVTIILTQGNANLVQKNIDHDSNTGHKIKTHVLQFPSAQAGLPDGVENFNSVTNIEMSHTLYRGIHLLQNQIEQLFHDMLPDCIVSDMFFPWTLDVATELGIPRLGFRGCGYFALCSEYCIKRHEPHKSTDSDVVLLPGLPPGTEQKSLGMLMNSFHELEGSYEEYLKTDIGLKAWSLGPVSLWANKDVNQKAERCNIAGREGHEVIDWLNSKEHNSVLYVGFGSLAMLPATQLNEIAHGLEASGHSFIWVVRKKESDEYDQVFPEGFEERMSESKKGFIIKGWAPQMLILEHPAIGGQVTHCGWNSILEGLNSGLPMIAWPLFAEQFYNEKLLTDVLRIAVAVGVKEWREYCEEGTAMVNRDEVEKAVRLLMGGEEEAAEMRKRVRKLQEAAKKAVEVGGSSHANLMDLINKLKSLKVKKI